MQHDKKVVAACLSCLGSVVNNVTKNFALIRDCFKKYYRQMAVYRNAYEANENDPKVANSRSVSIFRRALFTVASLLRYFNFTEPELYQELPVSNATPLKVALAQFVQTRNSVF